MNNQHKGLLLCLFCSVVLTAHLHGRFKLGKGSPNQVEEKKETSPIPSSPPDSQNKEPVKEPVKATIKLDPQAAERHKAKASQTFDENPYISLMSKRFNIDEEKIKYLRQLHHGYREMTYALILARESQKEVGLVLKLRNENMSWKEINNEISTNYELMRREGDDICKTDFKSVPKKIMEERPNIEGGSNYVH